MTKKKSKTKGKKLTARQLQNEVFRLLKRSPKKRFNPKQILKKLKLANNKDSVQYALDKLAEQGKIRHLENYKYQLHRNERGAGGGNNRGDRKEYTGYVDMTRSGAAFIICEGLENDVFVNPRNLNGALNGDKVRLQTWLPRGRQRPEGEVKEVLQRNTEHFLGTIHRSKKYAFVITDKENMPVDIYVDLKETMGVKDGEMVVVRITKWHEGNTRSPEGKVTSVLGKPGSSDLEMKAILVNSGFELDFSEEVLTEANDLRTDIPIAEINRRRDLRKVPTFTIDPYDAKDFDDALSFQYLDNGHLEIGVHIADVTYYVQPGTALDKEAYKRSTSVYLVDRVLPMLPEKLSNELCSLRPNEEKCTFSAIFTFDKNDKIIDRWFGKTVTYSDHRFAYEDAQKVIEEKEGQFAKELLKVNQLAKKLRKERFKKGSIDFAAEEVKFRLDEDGTPTEVFVKERFDAHMLIEEFMLLANKGVARFIFEKSKGVEIPFVYRIHDEPDPDRVADLARFAKELGITMNVSSPEEIARSYNRLAKEAEENDALRLLEPLAIRTMAKAVYSTDNIGHYGLGFDYYSHFTSPIRRYSDVLAHRILEQNLGDKTLRVKKEILEEQCNHISVQERKAAEAERESIKYKQVEFIKKHVGETFIGRISGIIDRGMFVEIKENKCEGMVGFESLAEPFNIEDSRLKATGLRTGQVFKMGDEVEIVVTGADLAKRQIEMELVL